MNKRGLWIALAIVAFLAMILFKTNNSLVALDEGVNAAWSQVENQLQRRYDLIPNLVNTVKGYAAHEKDVLISVTEARSKVGSAKTISGKMAANSQLTSALGRLMVVMEKYPDLKANQNFMALQSQLEGTENRISVERRRYNEAVRLYNTAIRRFPASLAASLFHFERKKFFKADVVAQKNVKVDFSK